MTYFLCVEGILSAISGFGERVFEAHSRLETARKVRVSMQEIAAGVAGILGTDPVAQPTVSRWFKGSVPDLDTIAALARVLNVSPGWLAFGEGEPVQVTEEATRLGAQAVLRHTADLDAALGRVPIDEHDQQKPA